MKSSYIIHLDEANLVGNIQSVVIGRQSHVCLLLAIRSDEGVDLGSLHIVELLDRVLDLTLVGLDVNDEHQRVVLFDLLHCGFRVQGRNNRPELIHTGCMRDRLAGVLGVTSKAESLGAVERDRGPRLARSVRVGALECGFFGGLGFGVLGGGLALGGFCGGHGSGGS